MLFGCATGGICPPENKNCTALKNSYPGTAALTRGFTKSFYEGRMVRLLAIRRPMARRERTIHEKDCFGRSASVRQKLFARRPKAGHSRDRRGAVSLCDYGVSGWRGVVVPGNCEQRPGTRFGVQGGLQGQIHAGICPPDQ